MTSSLCWPGWLTPEQAQVHGTATISKKLGEHSAALVCALVFSSCSPEGDTEEVPAADVDITVKEEEVKEEQQENKEEEEDQTAQESEVIKVYIFLCFEIPTN